MPTAVRWEAAVDDSDGFAALGARPTRLTLPAGRGLARVQVLCGVQWAPSSSGDRWVRILKNGVGVDGLPGYLGPTAGNNHPRVAASTCEPDMTVPSPRLAHGSNPATRCAE